jgi:hypothetical protein
VVVSRLLAMNNTTEIRRLVRIALEGDSMRGSLDDGDGRPPTQTASALAMTRSARSPRASPPPPAHPTADAKHAPTLPPPAARPQRFFHGSCEGCRDGRLRPCSQRSAPGPKEAHTSEHAPAFSRSASGPRRFRTGARSRRPPNHPRGYGLKANLTMARGNTFSPCRRRSPQSPPATGSLTWATRWHRQPCSPHCLRREDHHRRRLTAHKHQTRSTT